MTKPVWGESCCYLAPIITQRQRSPTQSFLLSGSLLKQNLTWGKFLFIVWCHLKELGKGRKSKRLSFEPKDIKILKMLIKILYKNNFTRLDHLLILLHSVWGCVYVYRYVCVRQRIFFSVHILSKELHSCCTLQTGVQCKWLKHDNV